MENEGEVKTSRRRTITALTFVALFAALISAGGFIAIPIGPVPIALQNFFTLLAGLVLGPLLGAASVALFILAGVIGAPVFANNGSPMGIARIIGPTGGYLFGYILGALVAGFILVRTKPGEKIPLWRIILAAVAGMLAVYIPGLIQLKMVLGITWERTFAAGFIPFMLGDGIKAVVAALIAPRLRRIAAQLLAR